MSIDASFLDKVSAMSAEFGRANVDGIEYTSKKMFPVIPPFAAYLDVHSLASIVAYFEQLKDEMTDGFIHVESPSSVAVVSALDEHHRDREEYLCAHLIHDQFPFGDDMLVEEFIIALQAKFVQCDNAMAILKVVGNITSQAEHKTLDDGVTQTVTAKTGIAKVGEARLPNPVELSPFRTFLEVDQPPSKFVFRMKQGRDGVNPTCSLHEADGGAWKNDAIDNIRKYLKDHLPDVAVIA